jgi:hypothetical protein
MAKSMFNPGDIVRVVDRPTDVNKTIQSLGGKAGTVVGRKTGSMRVYYFVKIGDTVYKITHASNLRGPLSKSALTNQHYDKLPSDSKYTHYYSNTTLEVYNVVGMESEDIYILAKPSGKVLYVRSDDLKRKYTPIPKDKLHLIEPSSYMFSAYKLLLNELLEDPKQYNKFIKTVNRCFHGLPLFGKDVIKDLIQDGKSTRGIFKYKISMTGRYTTIEIEETVGIITKTSTGPWIGRVRINKNWECQDLLSLEDQIYKFKPHIQMRDQLDKGGLGGLFDL